MDHQERLEMDQFLEKHSTIDGLVQFFLLLGIVVLLPFLWAKDKLKLWMGL